MSRKANPLLIGAFVVGGLVLLAAALIVIAGGELFERKERAVMFFRTSIYGLDVGAPVVFRGVRVGSVKSIGIFYDKAADNFAIPVIAELESDAIRGLDGVRNGSVQVLPTLLERGLSAQLSLQSLLTGQLYVDLDLRPRAERTFRGTRSGMVEIPTTQTAIQTLREQFEGVDFRRMLDDLSSLLKSAGQLLSGPQLKQAIDDVIAAAASVRRIVGAAEKRIDPLLGDARGAVASTTRAMDKLGRAADGVDATADSLKGAGDGAKALLAPDSPLVRDLRHAAEQLAQTAANLRSATGADSGLVRDAERTLQDVSRASRALRELAETLERHPDALLRGRPAPEAAASSAR